MAIREASGGEPTTLAGRWAGRPARREPASRSALGSALPGLSLLGMVVAGTLFVLGRQEATPGASVVFLLPLSISAVALVCACLVERLLPYYISLAVRVGAFLLAVPSTAGGDDVLLILEAGVLMELCFFEPYPANLVETLGVAVAVAALRVAGAAEGSASFLSVLRAPLPALASGVLLSLLGSQVSRYRELAVGLREERERLTSSVVQLTRANSAFQDYAVSAQEKAAEGERQRITRDIHDIVGYALTNNIMLLEAAMDLMQENPLALPSIIETARGNAEEGLRGVRSALYRLRRQEAWYPVGAEAIGRLVKLFEQATAIRVRCDFCNLPPTISERIDSTLYHLVQESLVNTFRHGSATDVRIVFWYGDGLVRVRISDNGVGAHAIQEGIGIRGMRERVEGLGGSLRVASTAHGFSVGASIPLGANGNEDQSPDTHR